MVHVLKIYEGDTPKIIVVLGLQNENVDKKVSLTVFCERIGTYIMKEYTNGEDVITVTKDMDLDVIEEFKKEQKSVASTNEEKKSEVDVEIKKEEIKTYVRHLKILESNMKNPTVQFSPIAPMAREICLKVRSFTNKIQFFLIAYGSLKDVTRSYLV